ncbi:HdeD family acid-resistance protein [Ktedonosporobacter rubrisoli]|uniref:HdeD family acid-resistance protein n=1 Tax=Ktedonosporobacter rubrisoli TaxID=2509675 RepID=A0A4P6K3A7_KTERU|nr:HdeD family acid-resistance protein [Ktedonosporobacter rubrisoli]QBD81966.1 HdeD family acid-resistance protein [Ktedonosporobacter rubrisoli]
MLSPTRTLASRRWWQLLIRGIIAIIFGILAFIWPGLTLTVLVLLFGAFSLLDGIFTVAAAIEERQMYPRWWVTLLEGLVGIVVGILVFAWPAYSALVLLTLMAIWGIVTGVLEIVAAIWLRKVISGEWLLALGGILSIIFGLILFIEPKAFILAVIWIIGAYAILFGIVMLVYAFALRSLMSARSYT